MVVLLTFSHMMNMALVLLENDAAILGSGYVFKDKNILHCFI